MPDAHAAQPTDETLLGKITARLHGSMDSDLEQIQIDVVNGQVTLTGTVEHEDGRQRAEDSVRSVAGVTYVLNNLRVAQAGTTGATG